MGRRRIFVAGLALFTVASFLAGSATNAGMLMAMRSSEQVRRSS